MAEHHIHIIDSIQMEDPTDAPEDRFSLKDRMKMQEAIDAFTRAALLRAAREDDEEGKDNA